MGGFQFPPVEEAVNGLLALGGNLEMVTLVAAYKKGIFPWPFSENEPVAWFSPDPRGVLDWNHLHLSRSFKKFIKKHSFEIRYNQNFDGIIEKCAKIYRKNQMETWLTRKMQKAYNQLFERQLAWCAGCYEGNVLQGGIYGVCMDGIVSAESMFHLKSNTSKLCLISVMEKLNHAGIDWLDTQMVTPVVASFGGRAIPRQEFIQRLSQCPSLSRKDIFDS